MCQDINQKAARKEFCGSDGNVLSLVMKRLDEKIADAKKHNDKKLKKQLKRRQVEQNVKSV